MTLDPTDLRVGYSHDRNDASHRERVCDVKRSIRLLGSLFLAYMTFGSFTALASPSQYDYLVFQAADCDAVSARARGIMIGRQHGLTRQGARDHLATDTTTSVMVTEAYGLRVHHSPRASWEAVDTFGELWRQRCEEATLR